jgi:hypothetical protein
MQPAVSGWDYGLALFIGLNMASEELAHGLAK